MLGKPKYDLNDKVTFKLKNIEPLTGIIAIIDKFGTFEQKEDVSYDILVESCDKFPNGCLFKHIPEPLVYNTNEET